MNELCCQLEQCGEASGSQTTLRHLLLPENLFFLILSNRAGRVPLATRGIGITNNYTKAPLNKIVESIFSILQYRISK
uniref:Uncharacterized protein n=1 Tax=Utricularia reniformis TaxID=192314 RepID=A0A1Y0B436_9LAMI|nr:hypothetical protein AEK19_MT1991 [Utricularia reniformis]ART32154.1 hypothetical protein AEK19_MT1991 [Utricularia reniformis]